MSSNQSYSVSPPSYSFPGTGQGGAGPVAVTLVASTILIIAILTFFGIVHYVYKKCVQGRPPAAAAAAPPVSKPGASIEERTYSKADVPIVVVQPDMIVALASDAAPQHSTDDSTRKGIQKGKRSIVFTQVTIQDCACGVPACNDSQCSNAQSLTHDIEAACCAVVVSDDDGRSNQSSSTDIEAGTVHAESHVEKSGRDQM